MTHLNLYALADTYGNIAGKVLEQSILYEVGGVDGAARRVKSQDPHAGAVINGGELIKVFTDFASVDLNPISWNGARVAFELLLPLQRLENRHAVLMQYLPDRAR